MDLQVIDNFLGDYQFKSLQTTIMGDDFPWYYNRYVTYAAVEDGRYQFVHQFLNFDKRQSHLYHLMSPFERLGTLIRIKSNMLMKTVFHRRSFYHIDEIPGATRTAIYYINTCNGYTKFKKSGRKIKSVANRMVIFDPSLQHASVSQTDEKSRVVINFNYASN